MVQLEQYEWLHLWWEEAAKNDLPRILLIGDSITNAFHPYVKNNFRGEAYVDKLATSKSIDNPSLIMEIDYMLKHGKEDPYKIIHFNNGLHGWHLSSEEYRKHYDQVIQHLKVLSTAVIVLALTTPVSVKGVPWETDPIMNNKVQERNRSVSELALQYGLVTNDLYSPMLNRSDLRADNVNDTYHFNENGHKLHADFVTAVCKTMLELEEGPL